MDLEQKYNRAMKFLKGKGHAVTQSGDGHNLTVDRRNCKVLELHELAAKLHPAEWYETERNYLEDLLRNSK